MTTSPEHLAWPVERLDEAIEQLARRCGWAQRSSASTSPGASEGQAGGASRGQDAEAPSTDLDAALDASLDALVTAEADRLGLEIETVEAPHNEAASLVRGCGPAVLRLAAPAAEAASRGASAARLLVIIGRARGRIRLLGPDLNVYRHTEREVAGWLCHALEAPLVPAVEGLLERLQISPKRVAKTRRSLLEQRLRHARVGPCWLLRLPPSSSFWRQLKDDGLVRQLAAFLGLYAVSYGLLLASWWVLGRGALSGHLSRDWLLAWALLLLTSVVPQQGALWAQAKMMVVAGTHLKRRLMHGALQLEPDEIRHQGAGQLLGRVIESEALQTHALLGGFLAALGVIEVVMSGWVLSQGALGGWHLLLLLGWLIVVTILGGRYLLRRQEWTEDRLTMTHELVESLVGHRTRLAQERRQNWHLREDRQLATYLETSRRADRERALLAVTTFAWILVGIVALLPAFVAGDAGVTELALSVGGVLLGFRAFSKLTRGYHHLAGAWISWQQAGPIFRASSRGHAAGHAGLAQAGLVQGGGLQLPRPPETGDRGAKILEAQDLVYRYRDRARPVLDGCSLQLFAGDRVLLEGPSGGGKSTLAGLLTRLRSPSSGLLLLGGLDPHTVPANVWRRRVVAAPQFHENHVFTETFAFNLLMGRGWPPRRKDMAEAREVCQELGLGSLLERMPAGLLQVVGETGWQLSHGERSRLFMARALLQGADIVILDESFAALDPENFQRALACALKRAPTLIVIAHP